VSSTRGAVVIKASWVGTNQQMLALLCRLSARGLRLGRFRQVENILYFLRPMVRYSVAALMTMANWAMKVIALLISH